MSQILGHQVSCILRGNIKEAGVGGENLPAVTQLGDGKTNLSPGGQVQVKFHGLPFPSYLLLAL